MNHPLAALTPVAAGRSQPLGNARLVVNGAAVVAVALAAAVRLFHLLPPLLLGRVGTLAAVFVGARFALTLSDVARGRLPWTRLPFAAGVAGEIALGVVGFPRGAELAHILLASVEIAVIVCAVVAATRAAHASQESSLPVEERIAAQVERIVPAPLARVIAFELGIFRAALGPRSAPRDGHASYVFHACHVFAYGAESPLKMLLLAYPLVLIGDGALAMACIPARFVAAHVVVAAIGVYGFVWLLGVYRSMLARPHVLEPATLRLHRGLLGYAVVPRADIVAARPVDGEEIARLRDSPGRLDLGGERVLLTLREPVACRGAFRSRAARTLVVSVDDPRALCSAVTALAGVTSL